MRSLDTCGPEEGPWELARERGEAAAIGQRKQESLPSLRIQRCKHCRRGVQENTHVWGLGNEAEVRGFDYRIAVLCLVWEVSDYVKNLFSHLDSISPNAHFLKF